MKSQPKPCFSPAGRGSAKLAILAVGLLCAGAYARASATEPPARPPSVYWGAWIGAHLTGTEAPWDMNALRKFSRLTGKSPSLVQFASPFANCASSPCFFYDFPTAQMKTLRRHGVIPFFNWGSQSIPWSADEPDFQLADVIDGTYDSYIRHFALKAKKWGHPFFLRFNHEMNGHWFPWSEGVNGNAAGQYVAAWRHVHDLFTSIGATNVTWVWCPNVDPYNAFHDLGSLYPGGNYVDWTCLDGYNRGTNTTGSSPGDLTSRWESFDFVYRSSYLEIVKRIAPFKPMVIGEVASSEYGGSKGRWIRTMFSKLQAKYPRVRGLLWFENDAYGMDWPIESSLAAVRSFRRGIRNDSYAANAYAHISGSPIRPPR